PGAVRHREHEQGGAQGTAEGGGVDGGARQAGQHGEQGGDGGTPGGAENVGLGERVAQEDLHQHARDREQAADAERGQRARQPELPDQLPDRRGGGARQRLPHGGEARAGAAGGERHRDRAERAEAEGGG